MFVDIIKVGPCVIFTPEASRINVTVLCPYPSSRQVRSMSDFMETILEGNNKKRAGQVFSRQKRIDDLL